MKKGLLFLIVIATLFWAIFYMSDMVITDRPPADTADSLQSPLKAAGDAVHRANRHIMETSIEIFRQREKRPPDSLEELVEKGYLSEIPDSGSSPWNYDPNTGRIK